jgi:hypothetical protein
MMLLKLLTKRKMGSQSEEKETGWTIDFLSHEETNWIVNEANRSGTQIEKLFAAMLRLKVRDLIEQTAATVAKWEVMARKLDTAPPGSVTVTFPKPVRSEKPTKVIKPINDPETGAHLGYELYGR